MPEVYGCCGGFSSVLLFVRDREEQTPPFSCLVLLFRGRAITEQIAALFLTDEETLEELPLIIQGHGEYPARALCSSGW